MSNIENRAVGRHSHSISHDATKLFGGHGTGPFPSAEAGATITVGNTGSVAGTNAPYIQYLVCSKD